MGVPVALCPVRSTSRMWPVHIDTDEPTKSKKRGNEMLDFHLSNRYRRKFVHIYFYVAVILCGKSMISLPLISFVFLLLSTFSLLFAGGLRPWLPNGSFQSARLIAFAEQFPLSLHFSVGGNPDYVVVVRHEGSLARKATPICLSARFRACNRRFVVTVFLDMDGVWILV